MGKYWLANCPKGTKSKYPLLVFDSLNKPFLPLSDYYNSLFYRTSKGTAIAYLNAVLPFFTFLKQNNTRDIYWDSEPNRLRIILFEYITQKLHCKVRQEPNGIFQLLRLTAVSKNTVHLFLTSLKGFYSFMIDSKQYNFLNPLIESFNPKVLSIAQEQNVNTSMPQISGISEKQARKWTDTYYKLIGEKWIPNVIDDPLLPRLVLTAGQSVNWNLRDTVITRMLFESGARISEIIGLTVGDYKRRSSVYEFTAFSKGSHGRRVKFIRVSSDTITLLVRYIDTERIRHDAKRLLFDQLPESAPLFLSLRGSAYTYKSWYSHWQNACRKANLQVNPHKLRHWYVTQAIRTIYETSSSDGDIQRRLRELIEYMKWRSPETLESYQHYFDAQRHAEIHDIVIANIYTEDTKYLQNKKSINKKGTPLDILEQSNPFEFLLNLGDKNEDR